MKTAYKAAGGCRAGGAGRRAFEATRMLCLVACLLLPVSARAHAGQQQQQPPATKQPAGVASAAAPPRKLPSADKIIGDYVKALGGRKRLAAIRDATYEWTVERPEGGAGAATTQAKAPASARTQITLPAGETAAPASAVRAANARTAWRRSGAGEPVVTLTGSDAYNARLESALRAGRLSDYKKLNLLARTVGSEQYEGEPAYVVELSTREGARLRLTFAAASRLLLRVAAADGSRATAFGDYRPEGEVLEPHLVREEWQGGEPLTLRLRGVRRNTGLGDALFDPPGDAALDIPALLRDLARNQREVDRRINDYTFTRRVTERKVNDRGEVTKETVTVREVYPVVGWGWVQKLVSENGAPLPPERAAKEERRVAEELAKAERELPKLEEKRARERAERAAKRERAAKKGGAAGAGEEEEGDVGIATFLRASEFVSPRRERLRERDAVVFDFRPRPGFRPSNRGESIVSKLVGVVWIDPADRHVMRLEGRFAEGYKVGGGLLASIRPGSAFVFEQTRLPDGVWLPLFSQVNASAKIFLFAGVTINETHEFGDFKRFSTKAGDATLDAPKTKEGSGPAAEPRGKEEP